MLLHDLTMVIITQYIIPATFPKVKVLEKVVITIHLPFGGGPLQQEFVSGHMLEHFGNNKGSEEERGMLGLPMAIWYLIFLLFFVAVLFVGFKRPIYEVMALAFVFIVVTTGRFDLF